MPDVPLDPIVAKLASALVQDGKTVVLPDGAVREARAKLRAVAPGDKQRLAQDLVAWSLKLQRLGGNGALGPRIAAAELALELLGDEQQARDMFGAAGLDKDLAHALGARVDVVRAPTAAKPAAQTVKPVRGLKR